MQNDKITILLAGMSNDVASSFSDIFNGTDYSVINTCSGKNFLNDEKCKNADCLVIDFNIWNNELFTVEKSVLAETGFLIPVIFTGDCNNESLIAESFRKGADDFISIPLRKHDVIARINNQISLCRLKRRLKDEVEKRTSDLIKSNELLSESVDEYRLTLKDLQENETLFLTIALNIPNSYLTIIEKNYTIGFAAGQGFRKSEIEPWRFIGLSIDKVFREKAGFVKNYFMQTFSGHETSFELEFGDQYLLYKTVPLFNSEGAVPRILVVAENISERRLSESRIKDSLHEKETLLKEIHHRVKNNMQLVCSMLNMQAEYINNNEISEILKTLHSRIYSMSLVHEKLYQNKQFSKINFSDYVRELVSEIRNSFLNYNNGYNFNIELSLQDENFTIEKAIPCGLILNELILNAIKHVSLNPGEYYIRITFEKAGNGCYRLTVSDNGAGLPENFDIDSCKSMGMMLIRELAGQLKGVVTVKSGKETAFIVEFGRAEIPGISDFQAAYPDGNKNILLVEDERIISRMLKKIVEECGYNIIDSVSTGRDAIDSAAKYNPDLIIMDIMLEDEIDGVEAAAEISRNNCCPIIFLTGNSDPATLKSASDINPFKMLTKPVEKNQLMYAIESALK